MNNLNVTLFGGVGVSLDGLVIGPFPTRWAAGLLAYLTLKKGTLFHRDVLATLFWPEEPDRRARKALRNALWRVRSLIEPDTVQPGAFLTVAGQNIGITGEESVRLDVADFDRLMMAAKAPVLTQQQATALEECVQMYRGDFMDGHDHKWCVYERERLRLSLLMGLERLLTFHYRNGDWPMVLQRSRAILRYDPFREHVHRAMMVSHYSMGDRPLAIRQYQECVHLLETEMKLAPMEATRVLHEQIQNDCVEIPSARALSCPLPSDGREVAPQLNEALGKAEKALSELRRLTEEIRPPGSEGVPDQS